MYTKYEQLSNQKMAVQCCTAQAMRGVARPDPYRCCEIEAQRSLFTANQDRLRVYARQGLNVGRLIG